MTQKYETNYLAEAFSARVARNYSASVWQSLFVARSEMSTMYTRTWSVVCAESPWDGNMSQDQVRCALGRLAAGHDGHLDSAAGGASLAAFADSAAALRVALALQRDTAGARLRIGVVTALAGLAQFCIEGDDVTLLVGTPLDRAPALLHRAVAGTVQLCARTYDALAGSSAELDACVVMAEYDRDELTQVALTLPPARSEFLSTFAGLGLS